MKPSRRSRPGGSGTCSTFRTRALTIAALLALAVFPAPARAGAPTAATCTIPAALVLVGTDAGGAADPAGVVSITVRRFTDPVPNSNVILEFTEAAGVQICSVQPDGSKAVLCPPSFFLGVSGYTDSNGQIQFTVVGRANRGMEDPQSPSLRIYADGVLLGTIPVSALDQDGGGLGPSDQSLWLTDYFSSQYFERSDFDGDGALGPSDLSKWLEAFFASGSFQNCAAYYCP